jgi:hypothetical protein
MRKVKLSDEDKEIITTCAGYGMTITEISLILKVGRTTLNRRLADDDTIREAYDEGRAIAKQKVVSKLFDLINKGEPSAIFFYLKCQCGWREKPEIVVESGNPITIYLPQKDEL